jgi:apolipoprotein D and lipocalin family protein
MSFKLFQLLLIVKIINAQIPSFGRCPQYEPMVDFEKERFLGSWFEIERYFTVTEVASKCIMADYERRADGNVYVKNYYTNRL